LRTSLDQDRLRALMRELARFARGPELYQIFLVGGGTAVLEGWRTSQ
jgi:hypothetical protein